VRILSMLLVLGCVGVCLRANPDPVTPPPRLIDAHVHVWEPVPQTDAFRRSLQAAFDAYHLQIGVVTGPHALVPGVVALEPNRLLGGIVYGAGYDLPSVATMRPLFDAKRLAVFGEIDAAWRGERLDTEFLDGYWEMSETHDIPVFVFSGAAPPGTASQSCCPNYRTRLGRPEVVEDVLVRHPRLRVDLMQAGWPYRDETIALMHAYPGVYADLGNLSGNLGIPRDEFHDYLRALMRAGLGKRLMFGSGLSLDEWPAKIGDVIAVVNEAPFLTAEQRDDIFYSNAARFLRVSDSGIAKPQL
jgi:predicted TIM-barrel fold metal-dependent hydrolase